MFERVLQICCFLLVSGLLQSNVNPSVNAYALTKSGPSCRNPNGTWGACISIYECESLLYVLRNSLSEHFTFVRLSRCDSDNFGKYPKVCCTKDTHFSNPVDDYRQRIVFPHANKGYNNNNNNQNPQSNVDLPRPPHCGSLTVSNKVFGGEDADLTEFSWMVQLEYRTASGQLVSKCAGSIINARYVVTAAHCVEGEIERKIGKLEAVRISEPKTSDCEGYGCSSPYQRFGIESTKVHENYIRISPERVYHHNDIALIRLDHNVEFSDYIQPVCLPGGGVADQTPLRTGINLMVAGWGHNGTVTHTTTKQKVKLPYVDRSECRDLYDQYFHVANEQLCAGGVFMKDSCSGDSGGPLMRFINGAWLLEGIVSFGRGCGLENRPGIYTEVRKYNDWIRRHLEP